MSGAPARNIQDEIRRLEKRQAEIEAQLQMHKTPSRHNALLLHLANLDKTLIALRQQKNRMR